MQFEYNFGVAPRAFVIADDRLVVIAALRRYLSTVDTNACINVICDFVKSFQRSCVTKSSKHYVV